MTGSANNTSPQSPGNRRTWLAIAMLVVVWAVVVAFRTPIRVRYWAWQLGRAVEPVAQQRYTNLLAAYPDAAIGPVGELLTHDEPMVRLHAVVVLGRANDTAACDRLLVAMHDSDPDVRQTAALGLARFGSGRVIPTLRDMLASSDVAAIQAAIVALQRVGSDEAVELIVGKLQPDQPLPVLVQAIESAGLMNADAATGLLVDLLTDLRPVATPPAAQRGVERFLRRNPRTLIDAGLPPAPIAAPAGDTVADYAARALRAITGESFGFRSTDEPERRSDVIRAWRNWLSLRSAM